MQTERELRRLVMSGPPPSTAPPKPFASSSEANPAASSAPSSERPILDPGQILHCKQEGNWSYRIDDQIGEGRCCVVYSAHSVNDPARSRPVAIKVYKRGRSYEGALQREQFILHKFKDERNNLVAQFDYFQHDELHCQVMELLECNVRQVIFRNERQGVSPWILQRFARDMLTALSALHAEQYVHADLKPANIMWSSDAGKFKLLDFGLTFHTDEVDLHQVQTKGYQAPEASEWNSYKEDQRKRRRRKLQGTYCDLRQIPPTVNERLHQLPSNASIVSVGKDAERWPSESSGVFTASEMSQCASPVNTAVAAAARGSSDFSCSEVTPVHSMSSVRQQQSQRRRHSVIYTGSVAQNLLSGEQHRKESPSESPASFLKPAEDGSDPAEWRRGHKHRSSSLAPTAPGATIDVWAFGCLLFELLTGSKLFRAGDKLASVLKPLQLVEMKIGETEIRYVEQKQTDVFVEMKDLLEKCLQEESVDRISSSEALEHAFLRREGLKPSVRDMVILPSNVLMLMDILSTEITDEDERKDLIRDIREEAEKFGSISSCRHGGGHVYLEFAEASSCQKAEKRLRGREFESRTVVPVFYPVVLWNKNVLH